MLLVMSTFWLVDYKRLLVNTLQVCNSLPGNLNLNSQTACPSLVVGHTIRSQFYISIILRDQTFLKPPENVKSSSFWKSHMHKMCPFHFSNRFFVIKTHMLLQNPLPHCCLLHLLVPRPQIFLFGAKPSFHPQHSAAILSHPDLHMLDALHLTQAVSSCAVAATVPPEPWGWQDGAVPWISGFKTKLCVYIYIFLWIKPIHDEYQELFTEFQKTPWHSIWHIFWQSIWHSIWHLTSILTFSLTFYQAIWHLLSYNILSDILSDILHSQWRSHSTHWALALAVEVRQCPLSSGACRWGLAVPTEIWSSQLRA